MAIWSDSVISEFSQEAELEIATRIKCINKRVALTVKSGKSVYAVPDDVLTIRRITWLGKKLEPKEFIGILQYPLVNPAGTIGDFDISGYSTGFNVGGSNSTPSGPPYIYFYSGYGENVIKLFPTPSQNIVPTGTENVFGSGIRTLCIIEYYAFPDITNITYRLPTYIARRIIKAFVLSKCYSIEGPGQDLLASKRYYLKFEKLLDDFKKINDGVFVSKVNTRSPQQNGVPTRISRPRLPTNFGTVVD